MPVTPPQGITSAWHIPIRMSYVMQYLTRYFSAKFCLIILPITVLFECVQLHRKRHFIPEQCRALEQPLLPMWRGRRHHGHQFEQNANHKLLVHR